MFLVTLRSLPSKFWQFHLVFWLAACLLLLVSGVSQGMSFELALHRNVTYALLGVFFSLCFLPIWDRISMTNRGVIVPTLLAFAYALGTLCSVLVNLHQKILFELDIETAYGTTVTTFILGGSLNFSLVLLVWCGFYLSLKRGLSFESGAEEQKAAEAIASIGNVSSYPEFIALEKLNKISLLPIAKISVIKAAGDYIELVCDGETYLKRESISNIESMLNPKSFQRVHRSTIVNLGEVKELEPKGRGDYILSLNSGEKVACSRTYMSKLKNRFDIAI